MPKPTKKKRIVTSVQAFGILNAFDEFWTPHTFASEKEAREYYVKFWARSESYPAFDENHKVVPVTITYYV